MNKEDLNPQEAERAFISILNNEQTDMQQGAFLSALTAKGETITEITDIALIPMGQTEQHGHHLPLEVDNYIATGIVERVAIKLV
ncbi:creatininase family protein [Alkalibaculum bacchi]|nr:creatininase family protein [Alkalibaculum bacchi]